MKIQLGYPSIQPITPKPVYNLSYLPVTWFDVPSGDVVGLENLILECEREENNQVMRKMSGDLLFYDATKDLLLTHFYNNNGEYMWIRIYDCECDVWIFKGMIKRDKIEWCSNECFVRTRASQYDEITDAYNSLNNVLDYDAYLASSEHIWNFASRFTTGLTTYYKYMEGVRIGGLLSNSIASMPYFVFNSSILQSINNLNGWTGDKYYYSARTNTTQIDKNPYYFACLLNNDISPLLKEADIGNKIRFEHRYTRTIRQFLEELKLVFNADYLIRKVGTFIQFIFERKDYFYYNSTIWKDCTNYDCCFEIDDRNKYSYANLKWQTLGFAEELTDSDQYKDQYNNIVEWNNPPSPSQNQEYNAYLPYVWMPLFGYKGYPVLQNCINIKGKNLIAPPAICIAGDNLHYTTTTGITEFVHLDLGTFDATNYGCTVHKANSAMYFNGDINEAFTNYGDPMPDYLETYEDCNLYDNFHFIESPRNIPNSRGYRSKYSYKNLRFTMTVDFSCDDYLAFTSESAVLINVNGATVKGIIKSASFNFQKRTVTLKGII